MAQVETAAVQGTHYEDSGIPGIADRFLDTSDEIRRSYEVDLVGNGDPFNGVLVSG